MYRWEEDFISKNWYYVDDSVECGKYAFQRGDRIRRQNLIWRLKSIPANQIFITVVDP